MRGGRKGKRFGVKAAPLLADITVDVEGRGLRASDVRFLARTL